MLIEKNDLIIDFEEKERAFRLGFKEKEKLFNEEKTKLMKTIEEANNLLKIEKVHVEEGSSKILDLDMKLKEITKANEGLQKELWLKK
jgi:hypothetical protein